VIRNAIAAAAFALLSVALFWGYLRVVGSPGELAAFWRDSERVEHLTLIARRLRTAYPLLGNKLPQSMDDDFYRKQNMESEWVDPSTRKRYRYGRIDDQRFWLEADFELDSKELERRGHSLPGPEWRHGPGAHRIVFDVRREMPYFNSYTDLK